MDNKYWTISHTNKNHLVWIETKEFNMTVYDTERDYIRDQLSSYRKAKKELNKIIQDFLVVSHEDYRGDNEKIIKKENDNPF